MKRIICFFLGHRWDYVVHLHISPYQAPTFTMTCTRCGKDDKAL
jgi:hypothetical protein